MNFIMKKLLFVCNVNKQRSPTAEELFKKDKKYIAKSCGIFECKKRINKKLVNWADIVFVMEAHQVGFVKENFDKNKLVIDLEIPDLYQKNEHSLIKILKQKLKKQGIEPKF